MPGPGRAAVLAATAILAACAPSSVPLPPQRRTFTGPERHPFAAFVNLADPHAEAYIVRGVRPEGRWAWTAQRAELRFRLEEPRAWRFAADLFIAGQTLRETGPVTISFFINGKLLGKLRADEAREFSFDQPVPPGWLDPAAPVAVAMEADPVWRGPDGKEFGFLLVSAGFRPQ